MIGRGAVLGDRYELRERIGVGGSGEVWRAHDEMLHREVAVKLIGADVEPDRLQREARAAARVSHPNVVAVYDAGGIDDRAFLVMELVHGVDLATVLRHGGALPPAAVAAVARDLARALQAVHAVGFVHRDVTPGNVMVDADGTVKLTDLGTARLAGGDGIDRVTRTGIVIGTVDFLAPEQLGPEHATTAADIYAAGLVLRTCGTAERPFGTGTVSERAARRLTEDPPPPSGPDWLRAIVAATCRRDPGDRPQDGTALVALFDQLLPTEDDSARPTLADRVAVAAAAVSGDDSDATGPSPSPTDADADAGAATVALSDGSPPSDADVTRAIGELDDDGGHTAVLDVGPAPTATTPPVTAPPVATPPASVPPAAPPSDDVPTAVTSARRTGDGRRRSLAVLVGVLLVVAAAVVGVGLVGDGGLPGGGGGEPIAIASVTDHDPLSDDRRENPDQAGRAIDGDGATAWTTVGYESAELGGLKDGVGLVLDLGAVHDVRRVQLDVVDPGIALEVYVSTEPPDGEPGAEGSATLLGSTEDAPATTTLTGDARGRYVTVWITRLTADGSARGFGAGIAEARVRG